MFSPFETRMIVRPEEEADEPAIRALLKAAFPGPDEARLVDRLRADGSAELSLVAVDGDTIVGHILFSPLTAPFRALGLAPVAVLPGRPGESLGSAPIRHGPIRKPSWRGKG